jgi:hypothetical protein
VGRRFYRRQFGVYDLSQFRELINDSEVMPGMVLAHKGDQKYKGVGIREAILK